MIILSLLFSALFGAFLAQKFVQRHEDFIKIFLSFTGAFLFGITITHLFPKLYLHNSISISTFILLGFLIQLGLESLSSGIEHGHIHTHEGHSHVSLSMLLGLGVHAFLDGLPLSLANSPHDHSHWQFGIILHKIPEAFALMIVMMSMGWSNAKRWFIICVFAMLAPSGYLLGDHVVISYWQNLVTPLLALVAGGFLHISATILFESGAKMHGIEWYKLLAIIFGFVIAIIL